MNVKWNYNIFSAEKTFKQVKQIEKKSAQNTGPRIIAMGVNVACTFTVFSSTVTLTHFTPKLSKNYICDKIVLNN